MLLLADNSTLTSLYAAAQAANLPLEGVVGPVSEDNLPSGMQRFSALPESVSRQSVLAGGTDPEVWKRIPEFLRQGRTVWVALSADQGSSAIYPLIPLDEEFPGRLRPIWECVLAPPLNELRRLLATGDLGAILQLQWETTVDGPPCFPIEEADRAWLQTAAVLRSLTSAEFQRVTAIHSGIGPTGITTASVSLSGEGVPDAMWIYRRGNSPRSELTVTTERGTAQVIWNGDQSQLLINCREIASPGSTVWLAPVATAQASPTENPPSETGSTWTDAVRAFDLLDAARRSIRRRRTVELQFESTSERSQFKTHMTTVGCGLLLATMFGLFGLLLVGRLCDPRDAQQKQAETVGFVLRDQDFEPDSARLNSRGREGLAQIIVTYNRHSSSILIQDGISRPDLAAERRAHVVTALTDAHLDQPDLRTLTRPLHGGWFQRLMLVAWVILFLPMGIFLAIQLLITVTPETLHPVRESTPNV
ncbi:MAG: hypothetical protein DWH91_11490 [Planctomycetota bacterium]|nr:MAG: hypothetical protein DWH91_11490 [Planctomycetota bacterium]